MKPLSVRGPFKKTKNNQRSAKFIPESKLFHKSTTQESQIFTLCAFIYFQENIFPVRLLGWY